MLTPNNQPTTELADEEGISEATPYNWRQTTRAEGRLLPDGDTTPAASFSADKFAAVVETAALNGAQLSAYCREQGLYPEKFQHWREACEKAKRANCFNVNKM